MKKTKLCSYLTKTLNMRNHRRFSVTYYIRILFKGAAEFNWLFHTFFTHLANFVWQRFKIFNLNLELFSFLVKCKVNVLYWLRTDRKIALGVQLFGLQKKYIVVLKVSYPVILISFSISHLYQHVGINILCIIAWIVLTRK